MARLNTPRRSADQWQAIIEQWQNSGLSAPRFCQEQSVGYASFCQWRKRFAEHLAPPPKAEPNFIDLASLAQSSSHAGSWHIVLSLGNGVELTLSQG